MDESGCHQAHEPLKYTEINKNQNKNKNVLKYHSFRQEVII